MKEILIHGAKTLYRYWMKFAHVLGWINTRIILTIFYVVIFAPIGLVLRLLRKDLLDQSFGNQSSYWLKREVGLPKERYLKPY